MSDTLIEAGQSDALVSEVAGAIGLACGRPPSAALAPSITIPAITAAQIVVSRLRAAGISDLVIAKALVDQR
jgi:hypothetical protein